ADASEPGPWWPPASVRDLLRTRLQAVSEAARQMLTAAAVLGSDSDADLLRSVSGRGEDEIVEAIDEALARTLLTEIPPPSPQQAPSYGFPYEALRRTVYESATLARRRLLHGRAADVHRPTASRTRRCAARCTSRPPWPVAGCCTGARPTSSSAGTSAIRPPPGRRPWRAICSWQAGTRRRRSGGGGRPRWPASCTPTPRRTPT